MYYVHNKPKSRLEVHPKHFKYQFVHSAEMVVFKAGVSVRSQHLAVRFNAAKAISMQLFDVNSLLLLNAIRTIVKENVLKR